MSNPFEKPTIPKNNLQLLQQLIFEPILLYDYDESLDREKDNIFILKTIFSFFFTVIVPLTIVLYFITVGIIAVFDLPLIFPPNRNHSEEFLQQWQSYSSAWEKGFYFISVTYIELPIGLAFGLIYGFIFGLEETTYNTTRYQCLKHLLDRILPKSPMQTSNSPTTK